MTVEQAPKLIKVIRTCPYPGCPYFYRGLGSTQLREKGLRQHEKRVHQRLWKIR